MQALPTQLNAVEWLFDRAFAAGHADRPLFRSDERTLTYAQARAEVNRIAQVLAGMGLQPGNRVLLRGGNSIAMALAWLAVVQSGLIAVATMPLLRATELKAIIDKARPAAALCDVKLQDELKAALALSPETAALPLRLFNTGDAAIVVDHSLEALARHAAEALAPCPTSADDIALQARQLTAALSAAVEQRNRLQSDRANLSGTKNHDFHGNSPPRNGVMECTDGG